MNALAAAAIASRGSFLSARPIFVMEHAPLGAKSGGAVVIVPPFAEEMNRSRRMFTLLGQALGQHGVATFVVDLSGTGESGGDFGEATWDEWLNDVALVVRTASERGHERISLVGVRLGAALALDCIAREMVGDVSRLMLWQPVLDGSAMFTQFLRLRLVSSLKASANAKETTSGLRTKLNAGESLEIAGYTVSPALAKQIDTVRLADLAKRAARPLAWLEVLGRDVATAPSANTIAKLRGEGVEIDYQRIEGEPFWSAAETTVVPALIEASCRELTHARHAAHV
jgi:exosortase A-associated hydrolase 2